MGNHGPYSDNRLKVTREGGSAGPAAAALTRIHLTHYR